MRNCLRYNDYLAIVEFSSEDDVFFGKINGIRDVVTFEADTVLKLQKTFREAVDDYVEMCRINGKEIDKLTTLSI